MIKKTISKKRTALDGGILRKKGGAHESASEIAHRLEASELRYRRLFETAQDGILILDAKTAQIVDVNPYLVDMLGYSKEEFLGKKLWEVGPFKNTDEARAAFLKLQVECYIRYEDMPLQTKDGRLINVEFVSNVYPVDGTVVIQCNIRDITDRRRVEEALKQNQQQQLQVRDQFLSRMSHELRSPLTPVHQFVTILLDGLAGDLNAEQHEYLVITLRNVNAVRTMVSDLLDVTRAESGKLNIDLRCVYLAELVPQVLKAFQLVNTKYLSVNFDVPGNLPPVCADPDRVQQILDNLLDNAIKFTPEKGSVSVNVRVSDQNPGFIQVSVTDTGRGIADSEYEKIFEYLYQLDENHETDHRGLGIGLYICNELVSSQGGRIWVESEPGQGSTFFFTLPIFSLESRLASIVKAADLVTHSVALITVEVSRAEDGAFTKNEDQIELHEIWAALQSCTLPNLVVLLPRVPHTLSSEYFFIVACANQSSAELLVEKINSQLKRCQKRDKDSGSNPKVSFTLVNTRSKSSGLTSKKSLNKEVVGDIENIMKETLYKEGGLYDWAKSSNSG